MNTPNNRRRLQSMEQIESAFTQLIQQKELAQISVSELCKVCGLNRSTFYANYTDIYDLADRVRDRLEQEVGRLYESERTQRFNSNDFLKLFRHIRENQLFYRTYFKLGYDADHQVYLYDSALARLHFENRHIEYHLEFFRSGFNAIVKRWLANGCRETPEEMEEIIKTEYNGRQGRDGPTAKLE